MKVNFQKALFLLKEGNLVAVPTETVYGLAGRIDREKTLEKIFKIKKRPFFDPLIVHCYNIPQALTYVSKKHFLLEKLLKHFSPGPFTLIVKKNQKISPLITGGKDTVALRIPQHPLTRKLIYKLGVPLAAPSANSYGKVSPVSAEHVLSSFKNKLPVLDGGRCKKALESTIVSPEFKTKSLFILRPGIITKKQIENFLIKENLKFQVKYKKDVFQPGGSLSHYKPSVPFYIIESKKTKKEIYNFLSKKYPKKKLKELSLFPSSQKTARLIYLQLRKLSKDKKHLIYVQRSQKKNQGLWLTIWDRLEKASSKFIKID
ncbi:MAG: threonylcarbamoyl-AMP synthase [Bdellovibrionales bacterium]|nr:threonylcarbamoyl-AMP synthase [Bdellovibrionales bacterium]